MNYQHEPHGVFLSEAKNTNGGLILATSPEAKQLFHLSPGNVICPRPPLIRGAPADKSVY